VNWPRISPEDSGELSAGKLGSRIGVDISKLWFVSRRPCSTPARQTVIQNGQPERREATATSLRMHHTREGFLPFEPRLGWAYVRSRP
jgi:hypothetical protein